MDLTDAIIEYRRFLKRKNYSAHTVKNTINRLKHFVVWLRCRWSRPATNRSSGTSKC